MAGNKLDIRVYPLENPQGNTKAFASIAVDDLIAIRGVRVIDSEKGLFVSMPQSQDKKTNEYRDVAFPVNGDLRKEINQAVLDEYTRVSNLAPDERSYDKPETDAANNINAADIKLDIRVYAVNDPQGNAKAFASITVEDVIAIRGLRVVEGDKGLFVTMPQSQDKNGSYHDIAFPLNGDLRKEITKTVLEKYESGERTKDKSLADGLKKGAERAAEKAAVPRESSVKPRTNAIG